MKKFFTWSMALALITIFHAAAQNFSPENNNINFEKTVLQRFADDDWWEPDTVWTFNPSGDKRIIFSYSEKGYLNNLLEQNWDSHLNGWINNEQSVFTYDGKNNLTTETVQIWRSNVWRNDKLRTYTYDDKNNLSTMSEQKWEENRWTHSTFFTYTYNESNHLFMIVNQYYENYNWINVERRIRNYDDKNNLSSEALEDWRDNNWNNKENRIFTYNDKNNLTALLVQNWNDYAWADNELHSYTYNEEDNVSAIVKQNWENDAWVNVSECAYWYDEHENCIAGIGSVDMFFYNNMQSSFHWNETFLSVAVLYKKAINPNIIESQTITSEVSVFPNPTNGVLNVVKTYNHASLQKIKIFNIVGQQVFETNQTVLDISHLPTGIYFVKIETEKGNITKKVVKQ